ncbi:MAG: META domain-containing protein [Actinomycetota bacterium]|nr:META domain-containing protein [Actinomycetota bacterium]
MSQKGNDFVIRVAFGAAVFAVLVAACGGSDSDVADTVTTAAPPSPTPAATVAPVATTAPAGVDVPELAGTNWSVTTYTMASGSLTGLVGGTEVTISFGSDGTISGFTGCNDYTGAYETEGPYDGFEEGVRDANDGQAISIASITVTEITCDSPGFVMEQEGEHLANLAGAARWFISRGNLILRSDDTFIEAEPAS